ncbi:MAG: hypothetical protein RLZZ135_2637 [Cyanobacteriota bacterium]|jgi:cation transporter-like permease
MAVSPAVKGLYFYLCFIGNEEVMSSILITGLGEKYKLGKAFRLVIFQEALFLAILGYMPGFVASLGMYQLLTGLTKLELVMTFNLALTVFTLTLAMCLISAAIASNKLRAADPADVF